MGSGLILTLELPRAAEPPALEEAGLEALNFLLVEDHPANRRILASLLERDGHSVTAVADAEAALAALDEGPVDAVLTDLQLPEQDGYALARAIRARPADADLPVFALTAHAYGGVSDQVRAAGMDGLLPKPPDLQRFYEAIADAMTSRACGMARESGDGAARVARCAGDVRLDGPSAITRADVAEAHEQLRQALEADDRTAAAKAAHRLAGVAAFAGLPQIAECARHIEDAACGGDLAAARKGFESMPPFKPG